jgi:opacity protein-like surface antigen
MPIIIVAVPVHLVETLQAASAADFPTRPQYAPIAQPLPQWAGLYAGISAGGALTSSQASATGGSQFQRNSASSDNFGDFSTSTDTISTATTSVGSGRHNGAILDAFLGANFQYGRLLGGIQLEASLSELNFNATGSSISQSRDITSVTASCFGCSPPVSTFSNTIPGSSFDSYTPILHSRWMFAAIAREGFLVLPETLLYGLAGWTYADFEDGTAHFYVNGPSYGGGVEQKLDTQWSLRLEYRYNNFRSVQVSRSTTSIQPPSTSTAISSCCGVSTITTTITSSQTFSLTTTNYNLNTQVIRIAVIYAFK